LKGGVILAEPPFDILVDVNEPKIIINRLKVLGLNVGVKALPVGDYLIKDSFAIERKTPTDFLTSSFPRKNGFPPVLWEQCFNLMKNYENRLIAIDGIDVIPRFRHLDTDERNAGILAKLFVSYKTPVITFKTKNRFIEFLFRTVKAFEPSESKRPYPVTRREAPLDELMENMLCQIRGIGIAKAKKLLEAKGSLKAIFSTPFEELKNLIGEKPANELVAVWVKRYKNETR